MLRGDVKDAHLGGEDETIVVRYIVSGRPETVAVQRRPEELAVREEDGGRPVPRLHHGCIVVVEILSGLAHEPVVLPGLRDQGHHRKRQLHAVHVQELQSIVEHGRVGSATRNDRIDLVLLPAKKRRVHGLLPGQHAVIVAPYGVYFPVVGDKTVRMRPLPARQRVGREPGVNHRDRRPVVAALKVLVEPAELADQEHALVDDRPRRQGAHIGVLGALLELAAHDVELSVEVDPLLTALGFLKEALADRRHAVPCAVAQNFRVDRHLPPADHGDALLGGDHLKEPLCKCAGKAVLRQKEHADPVLTGLADRKARFFRGLLKK